MPKVSVIVPVYNAEKYLQECMDSILRQTLTDLEVILVDDGSADSSPAICDRYAEQDARVQVIHQVNAGLSGARNCGLKTATGEFVAFVDSDDFIDENMYSAMVTVAEEKNAPLVICSGFYYSDVHKNRISHEQNTKIQSKSSAEFVSNWLWTSNEATVLFTVVWNKIYRREFFAEDLRFGDLRIHEDEEFSTRLYLKDFRVAFVDEAFYYYRANQQSITYKNFSKNNLCMLDILLKRSRIYRIKGWNRLSRLAAKNFCEVYIEYYQMSSEREHPEWMLPYRNDFNKMRMSVGVSGHAKDQIRYLIFSISPQLYKRLLQ